MRQYVPTVSQQLIWLDQVIAGPSAKYNIGGYACLQGSLSYDRFFQAIRQVLSSQEVYSSRFDVIDEVLVCNLGNAAEAYTVELLDFSTHEQAEEQALQWMEKEFAGEFEVKNNYLFCFKLLKIHDTKHFWFAKIHHLISDGWSFSLLLNQTASAYSSMPGKQTTLPVYAYSSYAEDDENYYRSEAMRQDRDFWLTEYKQLPAPIFPRLPEELQQKRAGNKSGSKTLTLSKELKSELQKLAEEKKVSLFHVFLGVLLVYFGRTMQQQVIAVGVPVLNRGKKVYRQTAGMFMNLLALKFTINPEGYFDELLQMVKQKMSAALRHQRYQYGNLVKDLKLSASNLLYDIRVSYEDFDFSADFGGLQANAVAFSNLSEHDKMAIYLRDYHDEGFDIRFVYRTDHFCDDQVSAICENLEQVMRSMASFQNSLICQWELLTAAQRQQLIRLGSGPERPDHFESFAGMWQRSCSLYGQQVAVSGVNGSFTYEQLNARVEKVAAALQKAAEENGRQVVLLLPRSEKMIVGMLAGILAEVCYIPLDPHFPAERIQQILQDSGTHLLLISEELPLALDLAGDTKTLVIEEILRASPVPIQNLAVTKGTSPCYIIYTSGTTGTPKGVVISHASLVDYVTTFTEYFQLHAGDAILQQANISFDTSVEEIFPVLAVGGRLHVLEHQKDLGLLRDALQQERITVLSTSPMVIKFLNESGVPECLRVLISGGDVLKPAYIDRLTGHDLRIYNTYGPTESTVCATYYPVHEWLHHLPIGKPIANREVYILDDHLHLQPMGVEGELFLGGKGIASGYINNSAITSRQFLPHILKTGERLYRTGDKGLLLPDGNILFRGRKDNQLSYRGYRIEPEEVEGVINLQPGVEECVVEVREFQQAPMLVAYIKTSVAWNEIARDTKQHLRKLLPYYMVPELWVPLEAIPLSVNGKIDRKALPAIERDMLGSPGEEGRAPASWLEEEVGKIWKNILQRETVWMEESFFELGGHSLNVMQLVNQYYLAFGVKIPVAALFQNVTIAAQSGLIATHTANAYQEIPVAELAADYPVSDGQRRLWVLSQSAARSRAYHLSGKIQLEGHYDPQLLEQAVQLVLDRHEILRTVFRENNPGELRQLILPLTELPFTINYEDFSKATREVIDQYFIHFVAKPFELAQGPLLRVALLKISSERYLFAYAMHHIISDGWSMEQLKEEVFTAYQCCAQQQIPAWQPLRIQYKDFAIWQQSYFNTAQSSIHREYWLRQFSGPLPVLDLSFGKPRPAILGHKGGRVCLLIGREHMDPFHAVCQQHQSTLFMGLLGVLNVLLFRYTGQTDIIVGTPVAGREHPELENQIGFYINTLALRTRFTEEDDFGKLLENIRTITLAAYAHQSYPFDRLVGDLGLARDLSHTPLFDIMLVLHSQQQQLSEVPEFLEAERVYVEPMVSVNYDLLFNFRETNNGYIVALEYNSEIFDAGNVIQLVLHFKQLLRTIALQPKYAISALDYLPGEEKHRLLQEFNPAPTPYADQHTIPDIFRQQVLRHPGHPAIVSGEQQLSYRQLEEASDQWAAYLLSLRIGAESLVPFCMDRSPEMIVVMLGILKAGAAYVPIDPAYPAERIRYMVEDSQSGIVITTNRYRDTIPGLEGVNVLCVEEVQPVISSLPGSAAVGIIDAHSLAYVIYTSGSTGRPKGVMIEHISVVNLIEWHIQRYHVTSASRSTVMAGVGFDASSLEIWSGLLSGSCLYMVDQELRVDSQRLIDFYGANAITHAFVPPALVNDLISCQPATPLALQYILIGGDRLPALDVSKLTYTLVNQYGPTESTVMVTDFPITRTLFQQPPIGKPIANVEIYILDKWGQLVPPGVVGELYLGGVQLARGYWRQPALTAERFVPHPFKPGARLYRTGDLGRWTDAGDIEYVGRIDEQVKIRGHRIELGEIEQALLGIEGVGAAAVLTHGEHPEEKYLCAYVAGEELPANNMIRSALREVLPEYMIPPFIMRLGQLPLTVNGKVDRRALPVPVQEGLSEKNYEAPHTLLESQVAEIWKEVLRSAEPVSRSADFFSIGGHSLRLMQLLNHYYRSFGVKLSMAALFEHTTIASQAALIENETGEGYEGIGLAPALEDYPLSDGQRRLWVLSQLPEASQAYELSGQLELEGEQDPSIWERAMHNVIDRHEILRTVFIQKVNSDVRQVIRSVEESGFTMDYRDYRSAGITAAETYLQEVKSHSIDLSTGPLLRCGLIRTNEARYLLYYTMHHIISDGWSMEVLGRELLSSYEALIKGEAPSLKTLPIQYKDYAVWQQERLASASYAAHRSYWLHQLGGELPVLTLPASHPRPAKMSYKGHGFATRIDAAATQRLRQYCTAHQTSLFMGILAVLKILLFRYTGQQDIIVGSPVSGRGHIELEDQIGFYLNALALRTRFSGDSTFHEILQQVRQTTLEAYQHQAYPFDRIVQELSLKRDTSRAPLFDLWLDLHTDVKHQDSQESSMQEFTDLGARTAKFDLTFIVEERAADLRLHVEFNAAVYDYEMVTRLVKHFKQLLEGLLLEPGRPVYAVNFLSGTEQEKLVSHLNATQTPYKSELTVIDLFEKMVIEKPTAIALSFQGEELTYLELSERSNQFAAYLQKKDITPGSVVAVCMGRSMELVPALLGILKAGATYMPIDPSYPANRIRYMLEDVQAKLLLLQTDAQEQFQPFTDIKKCYVDRIWISVLMESTSPCSVTIAPEAPAYIIYTSGSTGKPKGVVVTHQNLSNYLHWVHDAYLEHQPGNFGLYSSLAFDLTITSLFGPLISGGKLQVFAQDEDLSDLLRAYFRGQHQLNCIKLTPSHIHLLEELQLDTTAIRTVIVGGEQLQAGQVKILQCLNSKIAIYNEYGPTEATVGCIVARVDDARKITIGKPIANTKVYILDSRGQLVPEGVVGELYLGGVQLARGYWQNELLTAERFVSHPFQSGARLYRTGDLGRWDDEGNIEYIGRADEQVKIRGYRIELGEIEQALLETGLVREAKVLCQQLIPGNKELVAYVAGINNATIQAIKEEVRKYLPQYMLPTQFVLLEKLPLNQHGKVDVAGLSITGSTIVKTYTAPVNQLEAEMIDIVALALNINKERVGTEDNFFDLGANSLLLVRIVGLINQKWNTDLKVVTLFEYANIKSLVQHHFREQAAANRSLIVEQDAAQQLDDALELFQE